MPVWPSTRLVGSRTERFALHEASSALRLLRECRLRAEVEDDGQLERAVLREHRALDALRVIGRRERGLEVADVGRRLAQCRGARGRLLRAVPRDDRGGAALNRTTRSLSLTDEGAAYYERCTRILADLDEANASLARTRVTPRGRLRVDAPVALADYGLGAALPRFLERRRSTWW